MFGYRVKFRNKNLLKRQGKNIRKKIKGRIQSGKEQKSILRRPVVDFLSVTCF